MLTLTNATSYSDLQAFGRCPNKYRYRAILRIQPKRRAVTLKVGSLIHELMMGVYLGKDLTNMVHDRVKEIELNPLLFAEEQELEKEHLNTAARVVDGYFVLYQDDWEILHVEETFLFMLDNGEVISFTPDLVIRDRNGFVWIIDHKSTVSVPTSGLPFSDLQSMLYYAGVKELYPELKGFIFNYLRKKEPTEPRLNKTHNEESKRYGMYFVNNLKSIDTTYEVLRDFLESLPDFDGDRRLMDEPSHKQRLAELYDTNRFYWREQVVITEDQVQNVLYDVAASVKLINHALDEEAYPRVYQKDGMQACDRCEFMPICRAELLNWNTDVVLQEQYEDRDDSHKYYPAQEEDE